MRIPLLALTLALTGSTLAASTATELSVGTLTLHGTLETPDFPAPWLTVLIVAGSGPTDRDGNSAGLPGANDSLKQLAQGLAKQGIASVRYDKRGIGRSVPAVGRTLREEDLVFGDFVNDAAAWIRQMQADPRFAGVSLAGHSEGALIALAVANSTPVDAVVTLAGPGENLANVLQRQIRANLANPPELVAEVNRILAELRAGRRVASVSPVLAALFRPSVQPFLISAFQYDPAQLIKTVKAPVLIVQGKRDLQVLPDDARRLSAAAPQAKLLLIPGMNHVLKQVGNDLALNQRSYGDPTVTFSPALLPAVVSFLKVSLGKKAPMP
ncbi:alpha/beta hydrolase [Deinococcus aquatilis]|uniref:alpha/beta hydrolase n=1 Tax=Deinococcus aquatilis TaxID=519440 RepID=UPI000374CD74|nr:alpha/beta fold hydrolase [Deinococcus aquatilis]